MRRCAPFRRVVRTCRRPTCLAALGGVGMARMRNAETPPYPCACDSTAGSTHSTVTAHVSASSTTCGPVSAGRRLAAQVPARVQAGRAGGWRGQGGPGAGRTASLAITGFTPIPPRHSTQNQRPPWEEQRAECSGGGRMPGGGGGIRDAAGVRHDAAQTQCGRRLGGVWRPQGQAAHCAQAQGQVDSSNGAQAQGQVDSSNGAAPYCHHTLHRRVRDTPSAVWRGGSQ
jgi:hypothetical protein